MSAAGLAIEFLDPSNICGQTLLHLVSRGNAIIAELSRLADHIPQALLSAGDDNPMAAKYAPVLFDFKYLKTPEMYDKQINTSAAMGDLDDEFYASHEEVLNRFYKLFESVFRYIVDYGKYLADLSEGFYIQHTVADVLLDVNGKQLMCEALYLLGTILLIMDMRVPGPIRERLIIAHYRHKGESATVSIGDLAKLCRDTGFRPADPYGRSRPSNYPEEFFARFPLPAPIIAMIVTRLRSDDVYLQTRVYPAPEHRSFALANQATMLYVILYFAPAILHKEKKEMREIVDKHFGDNWVVPIHMGTLADLSVEWDRYKAAKEALAIDTLKPENVRKLVELHRGHLVEVSKLLNHYLTEGVLTETYVVDNLTPIMDCLRYANTSLRWVLLHRRTEHKAFRTIILDAKSGFSSSPALLDYMLRTALLELRLKAHVKRMLDVKETKWEEYRTSTAAMMDELAEYFSGTRALTRVEKDEDLQAWFTSLAGEIRTLDYSDATMAGRKIRYIIKALEDVTQFDVIDASANIKEFLSLAKMELTEMVRTVNVTDVVETDIGTIADMSFAWETINDYVPDMHDKIAGDPASVAVLRALFLKLSCIVEKPLERVTQANSKDGLSIAQYYSDEIVALLRRVMEVIPELVFSTLSGIIALQTSGMTPMPVKFELLHLPRLAQVEERHELARRTHQISVFTEGVLAMKKTLLGVTKVDPRQILTDGVRKHLVDKISRALHMGLVFDTRIGRGRDPKANLEGQLRELMKTLTGYRRSFEYVQDYIGIHGLRMWQEECTRIIAFNTEQECNKYLRRRILPDASKHQSTAIPLPLFFKPPTGDTSGAITFMGRLADAVVNLTDPRRTIYGPGVSGGGWYDATGREIAGLSMFSLLNGALGVPGLCGVDTLLGFGIEKELGKLSKGYASDLRAGCGDMLTKVTHELLPSSMLLQQAQIIKLFTGLQKKLSKSFEAWMEALLNIGQSQLLRRAVAHELKFACRLESNLLCGSLESLNMSLLNDMRKHYYAPESHPLPDGASSLLPAVAKFVDAAGMHDPLTNIYISAVGAEPQPFLGLWLTMFVVWAIPKFAFDREFGVLVRRKATDAVDGAPLVAGLVTVLKQHHPSVTVDWFNYMGQFVRSTIFAAVGAAKPSAVPPEAVHLVLFMQHVANVAHVPERFVHANIPGYIMETVGTMA